MAKKTSGLDKLSKGFSIFGDVIGAASDCVGIVKDLDEIKDNTRKREVDLYTRANISRYVSQEEKDRYAEERNNILAKYPDKKKYQKMIG